MAQQREKDENGDKFTFVETTSIFVAPIKLANIIKIAWTWHTRRAIAGRQIAL